MTSLCSSSWAMQSQWCDRDSMSSQYYFLYSFLQCKVLSCQVVTSLSSLLVVLISFLLTTYLHTITLEPLSTEHISPLSVCSSLLDDLYQLQFLWSTFFWNPLPTYHNSARYMLNLYIVGLLKKNKCGSLKLLQCFCWRAHHLPPSNQHDYHYYTIKMLMAWPFFKRQQITSNSTVNNNKKIYSTHCIITKPLTDYRLPYTEVVKHLCFQVLFGKKIKLRFITLSITNGIAGRNTIFALAFHCCWNPLIVIGFWENRPYKRKNICWVCHQFQNMGTPSMN